MDSAHAGAGHDAMLRRPSHFDSLSFTLQPVMEKMAVKFVAGVVLMSTRV